MSLVALACCVTVLFPRLYDTWPRSEWSFDCRRNLRQITHAMLAYHDEQGSFPPAYLADDADRPVHSWRVLLLPYLNETELYEAYRFDEPWDGPHNSELIKLMPNVFSCRWDTARKSNTTSYVVVTGSGALFDGAKTRGDIPDGFSNTILVVERSNSKILWTEPRDLRIADAVLPETGFRCNHSNLSGNGAWVAFADGRVSWMSQDDGPEVLNALITADGGDW